MSNSDTKHTEIHEEIREPVRTNIRARTVGSRGPLFVPPEIKEPGYEYAIIDVSDNNMNELVQRKRDGWRFVPKEHLTKYNIDLEELDDSGITNTYTDGKYICMGTGAGTRGYLMRIPLDQYKEIQSVEREENQRRLRAKEAALENQEGGYRNRKFEQEHIK